MTNGSGPHPKPGGKKSPAKKGGGKRKPAAELMKKGLKRTVGTGPKAPGT